MSKLYKCCAFIAVGVILFCGGIAYSENQEYKEHTVSKGDTLWGISSQEISDPFLWPKVWKENPFIKNPDLIYPGQKIRIPLYLMQKEEAPKPPEKAEAVPAPEAKPEIPAKEEAAAPVPVPAKPEEKNYLVDMNTLISSGYIADAVEGVGEVIGAASEATIFGRGDEVYVKTIHANLQPGYKFYVIHPGRKVKHPKTGQTLGYLIDVVGIVEVMGREGGQTKVRIISAFREVSVGDLLNEYYEMEQPLLPERPRTPDVKGFIVASRQMQGLNGQLDIVYLDKGKRDGIEVGDMIGIITVNKFEVPNGALQVISTKETTSTAIIRKSKKEVELGDKIGPL